MRVIDFLQPDSIVARLEATTKLAVLAELSAHLAKVVPGVEASALLHVLEERELLASTAIGDGIAIPHGKLDSVGHLVGALGRAVQGIGREPGSQEHWQDKSMACSVCMGSGPAPDGPSRNDIWGSQHPR